MPIFAPLLRPRLFLVHQLYQKCGNDPKAQLNLGGMYEVGRGVPQNDAEAVRLYGRSGK